MRVLVAAGRRVDPPDAVELRFPSWRVPAVTEKIVSFLRSLAPEGIIASAACGADILVLEAAFNLGIPYHIVLPFPPAEFREKSVVDRPGNWGPRFDALIASGSRQSKLHVISKTNAVNMNDTQSYRRVTQEIIERAASLGGDDVTALVVWNGAPTGADDETEEFRRLVSTRGWTVVEILTS